MTTGTVLFTIAHLALFIFTRRKYVRKFKKAQGEKAKLEVEKMQMLSQLSTYEEILGTIEENED